MRAGELVIVSGPPGDVIALVEQSSAPADLPAIGGAPDVDVVRAIMAEFDVVEIALLSYAQARKGTLVFVALRTGAGEWFDLQRQRLTITALEPAVRVQADA